MHSHTQNIFLQRDTKVKSKTFVLDPSQVLFLYPGPGCRLFFLKETVLPTEQQ